SEQRRNSQPSPGLPARDPARRWRTGGLPPQAARGRRGPGRRGWLPPVLTMRLGYLVVFGLLTLRAQSHAAVTVPYTEFTAQVQAGNVAEVFARGDTIEGTLRQARPVPDDPGHTYQEFVTERPTFAQDNLLAALQASGASVKATPVVQQR